MNYIELINQFWRIRRSKRITASQADLYFCLLDESNQRGWENPFEFPNKSICSRIDISEPTMIDARARLQQLGLIRFDRGNRHQAVTYEILDLNNLSQNRARTEAKPSQDRDCTEPGPNYSNIINKTKHKQKNTQNADLNNLSQNRVEPDGISDGIRYDPAVEDSLRSFIAAWNDRTNQKPYKALIPSDKEFRGFIDLLSRYGPDGPEMLLQAVCESEWLQREPKTLSWAIKPETATNLIDGGYREDFEKATNKQKKQTSFRDDPDRFERMKRNASP